MARLLCLVGAVIGVIGLIGWTTETPSLTTMVAGQPSIKPNTALGLLLIGLAGALRHREDTRGLPRTLSFLAAAVVLAIGVGTLAEYAFGIDLHIDELLFPDPEAGPYSGRPSPPTALALTFLAIAIFVFDTRPAARIRPSEWLALSSGLIAFTAVLGQIFGAGRLYRVSEAPVTGVAVPTAIGLLVLTGGLLLARGDAGLMRLVSSAGPGGMLLRRLALAAALGPVLLGVIASRLLDVLGVHEFALVYASLAAAATVVGLVLLTVTAVPLNRMHEALESARARSVELFEEAVDGIFVADLDGRYTHVNSAGCRMLRYTREELIGKTIDDLIPPEDCDRISSHKARLLAGDAEVGELTFRRKDGPLLPVEVSAKILPDGRRQAFVRDISERKRAQAEIQQSMERFELALRGADLAAWDWNIATGEVVFNARWAEMRGFRPDEVEPHVRSWTAGIHPDDLPGVEKALTDHFEGGASEYETAHRVSTKGGEWIWVLDRGRVFTRDAEGRPTRMVGTELDVTSSKHAEGALRLSEAKFSGIVSIAADAIVSVDDKERITLFNAGAEKIFGYARAEVIGAPLGILIPERLRAAHGQHMDRFASGHDASRRAPERGPTLFGRRKNGEEFPAEAAVSKLDVGGTRVFTISLRDVTEQRRRESEMELLAEAGAVLASSLDDEDTLSRVAELAVRSLADVCIIDIVAESDAMVRLKVVSGDPSKAAACDALRQLPLDRTRSHLTKTVTETKQPVLMRRVSPEMVSQCEEHRRALRSLAPQSVIVVPLMAHDKLLGAITLLSTTPSRVYEPRDVGVAEELARRAALSIENAHLYRAAQAAIKARDDVLGVVAHDLRNPLGTILMQASLLGRRAPEPERRSRRPRETIERAARRMNRLIQDLLDVTRMEAGRLSIEQARVSARQVAIDAVESQRALAASASVDLRFDCAIDLPEVSADRDRLLQVFDNLIGNAIKFTPPGGRITVGAAPREREVVFWVTDTGRGIDAKDVPHLFERFWQADKEERRRGAGLGLPIVKGIIDAHAGGICVESAPGRGTTFFFTIPLADVSAPERHARVRGARRRDAAAPR